MKSKNLYLALILLCITIISPDRAVAAAGQLDSTFGRAGIFLAENAGLTNTTAAAVAIDSSGRILIAGQAPITSGEQPAVLRLNPNGTLDLSFGNHGVASIDFRQGGGELATCLVVQSSGKIVVGLSAGTADGVVPALARLNTNGTLDTSFGSSGTGTANIFPAFGTNTAFLVQQPDGRLLVGGTGMLLARTSPNGILDTTFGQNGIASLVAPAASMVLQPDGKILTASGPAGFTDTTLVTFTSIEFQPLASTLARYDTNGTLDTTFGTQGRSASIVGITAPRLQINGDIVTVGPVVSKFVETSNSLDTEFAVARYNSNGGVDDTFGTQGAEFTTFGNAPFASPNSVVIQSNGDIIAAGEVQTSAENTPGPPSSTFGLARYTSTGALDSTFGSGGKVQTAVQLSSGTNRAGIAAIVLDANHRLVAAGNVSQVNSTTFAAQTSIAVARYLTQ